MKMKPAEVKKKPQESHEKKVGQPRISAAHTKDGLLESHAIAGQKGAKGRESSSGDARNVRTMSSIEMAIWGDLLR